MLFGIAFWAGCSHVVAFPPPTPFAAATQMAGGEMSGDFGAQALVGVGPMFGDPLGGFFGVDLGYGVSHRVDVRLLARGASGQANLGAEVGWLAREQGPWAFSVTGGLGVVPVGVGQGPLTDGGYVSLAPGLGVRAAFRPGRDRDDVHVGVPFWLRDSSVGSGQPPMIA